MGETTVGSSNSILVLAAWIPLYSLLNEENRLKNDYRPFLETFSGSNSLESPVSLLLKGQLLDCGCR